MSTVNAGWRGPNIVKEGLVLYLEAASGTSYSPYTSGVTWRDISGNGNNGTLTNGPIYSSANGGSFTFDGVDDYTILTKPSQIITSGSITINLWTKWTTIGTTISTIQTLIDNRHSSSPVQGFYIQDRPDLSKKLTFSVTPLTIVTSSFQVGNGSWTHIAATHSPGISRLYINGTLDGFSNESNMATVQPNISIGYWQFTPGRYLNGSVASTQIYNRALSDLEVLQNYNAQKSRFNL
jgi:hypothetical protein